MFNDNKSKYQDTDLPVHVELKLEKMMKKWFSDTGHKTMEGSHP